MQRCPHLQRTNVLYWSLLYSAILRSWADSLRSHVILHEWIAFYSAFLNIHRSGVLTALAWLVPQESAARESQSRRVLCTPYNHAPCHFMQSHIRKVYACLAVTCHLRFLQNERGLLRATAVTRGWNGHRNKSQHRKLTLEKKILPPLQQGFEPATFRSRVRRSNHWAIPAPQTCGQQQSSYTPNSTSAGGTGEGGHIHLVDWTLSVAATKKKKKKKTHDNYGLRGWLYSVPKGRQGLPHGSH